MVLFHFKGFEERISRSGNYALKGAAPFKVRVYNNSKFFRIYIIFMNYFLIFKNCIDQKNQSIILLPM